MMKIKKVEGLDVNVFLTAKEPDPNISLLLPNNATFTRYLSIFEIAEHNLEQFNNIVIVHSGRNDYSKIENVIFRFYVGETSLKVYALFDSEREYLKHKLRN